VLEPELMHLLIAGRHELVYLEVYVFAWLWLRICLYGLLTL
jgi:hypothetical protein